MVAGSFIAVFTSANPMVSLPRAMWPTARNVASSNGTSLAVHGLQILSVRRHRALSSQSVSSDNGMK